MSTPTLVEASTAPDNSPDELAAAEQLLSYQDPRPYADQVRGGRARAFRREAALFAVAGGATYPTDMKPILEVEDLDVLETTMMPGFRRADSPWWIKPYRQWGTLPSGRTFDSDDPKSSESNPDKSASAKNSRYANLAKHMKALVSLAEHTDEASEAALTRTLAVTGTWEHALQGHPTHVLARPSLDTDQKDLLTPAVMVWAWKNKERSMRFEEEVSEGEHRLNIRTQTIHVSDLMVMVSSEILLIGDAINQDDLIDRAGPES